ncbi:hypothetical protein GCM10010441_25200 [Kitasatospora paracochleata]
MVQCVERVGEQGPGDTAALPVGPDGDQSDPRLPGQLRDPEQPHVLVAVAGDRVHRRVDHGVPRRAGPDLGRHGAPADGGLDLVPDDAVEGAQRPLLGLAGRHDRDAGRRLHRAGPGELRVGAQEVVLLSPGDGEAGLFPGGGGVMVALVDDGVQRGRQVCQHRVGDGGEVRGVPHVDADEQPSVGSGRDVAVADHPVALEGVPLGVGEPRDVDGVLAGARGGMRSVHRCCLSGVRSRGAPGDTLVSRLP